ncbi:MAG: CPBP family intramembrane metalloprotease [Flavobacterium sp.]|nr:CPBP family intramembrane metalloprotease [Pedobacter sp.]
MPDYGSTKRHPFVSLILLLLIILVCAFVFTLTGLLTAGIIYGFSEVTKFLSSDLSNQPLIKLVQIFSSIGTFVAPAIIYARLADSDWRSYLKLNTAVPVLFLFTIIIMFFSTPLIELSIEINRNMKLPAILKNAEEWMRNQENQMAELTKQLLTMKTVTALMVNLIMIAVIPAIGEELIFRGCFQRIFKDLFKNNHLAVWTTAIIFSAIHMQFFGFIPRMLLGAMFGYLLVWSNTLWLPILAHFVNNAAAVITAYVYQQQGKSLDQLDQPEKSSWFIYVLSLLATAVFLWGFYQNAKKRNTVLEKGNGARLG